MIALILCSVRRSEAGTFSSPQSSIVGGVPKNISLKPASAAVIPIFPTIVFGRSAMTLDRRPRKLAAEEMKPVEPDLADGNHGLKVVRRSIGTPSKLSLPSGAVRVINVMKGNHSMTVFTIDKENNITAHADIPSGFENARFSSKAELNKLAAAWPLSGLVQVWNTFAGVVPFDDCPPVKKFTNRQTGIDRIWKAVQRLTPTVAPPAATAALPKAGPNISPVAESGAATARAGSKKAEVLSLLRRAEGVTLAEITTATGWQAHTVRGFISSAVGKKLGLKVESRRTESGERCYRVADAASG